MKTKLLMILVAFVLLIPLSAFAQESNLEQIKYDGYNFGASNPRAIIHDLSNLDFKVLDVQKFFIPKWIDEPGDFSDILQVKFNVTNNGLEHFVVYKDMFQIDVIDPREQYQKFPRTYQDYMVDNYYSQYIEDFKLRFQDITLPQSLFECELLNHSLKINQTLTLSVCFDVKQKWSNHPLDLNGPRLYYVVMMDNKYTTSCPNCKFVLLNEYYKNPITKLDVSAFAKSYPNLGVKVETVAENLVIPWSIDFAYDGRIFFSERTGTLQVIDNGIQKQIMALDVGGGEGGMLGIALDPDFEKNHYIYIYYTYNELLSTKNKLVRYVESNNSLIEDKVLLDDIPGASYHDGGRIKFGPDNKLYITTGDSGDPNLAQRLDSVAGKILRINSDGTIPDDNPFQNSAVYSYGHRNPQGIDWDKFGVLIATEHGPSGWNGIGHDEINLIQGGQNYGWPDVIGDETKDGMTSPLLHSGDDTWAPSGGSFYYGEIAQWDGLFFAASLRGEHLLAIEFDSEYNVISFEKLFLGEYGRLRDVVNGPDGLYVLTSNQNGRGSPIYNDDRILRITPLNDTIPKWIENIFVWYDEGKISEAEKRNAIGWLIDKGILTDDEGY